MAYQPLNARLNARSKPFGGAFPLSIFRLKIDDLSGRKSAIPGENLKPRAVPVVGRN